MLLPPQIQIQQFLMAHGGIALFGLLSLGIIGLPIPDESLLVFAGFLMAKGHMIIATTIIAAFAGSSIGISVSYVLGTTLGRTIITSYGGWVGITEKKLDYTHSWFDHIGKWFLLIGYFIPGVRHLTGIIAGVSKLEYWKFATFAYSGALIWSTTFLAIGYFWFK